MDSIGLSVTAVYPSVYYSNLPDLVGFSPFYARIPGVVDFAVVHGQ